MAKFLAVLVGAAIGLGVVWFVVIQPKRAAPTGGSPAAVTTPEGATTEERPAVPAPVALTAAEVSAAVAALTSEDDVVRGSAIEQWGAVVKVAEGERPLIVLQPALVSAFREALAGMPEDRMTAYVEAWGPTTWWVEHFAAAHGRYTAWRAGADDNIWIPFAYDQLDRFDPDADREVIRGIINVLVRSNVAKVRRRTLEAAAHYLGPESRVYALGLMRDPENAVARLAWVVAAKTGGVEGAEFDWQTGPRFVGEAALYALAVEDPAGAVAACEFIEGDPVISSWYRETTPLIRARAGGATDRETIVTINPGYGPARIFEEAIRVDELLSGNFPQYVQE
jgi:hypothetical protein